jgi:hypothetical protein
MMMLVPSVDTDIEGCRVLLVEIVRRAVFDWVTYRDSTRLEKKSIAQDAYTWLFLEDADHHDSRVRDGMHLFSFLGICDVLGLDPSYTRGAIKKLTYHHIQSIGRPKTVRRLPKDSVSQGASGHDFLLNDEHNISDLEDDFPPMPPEGTYLRKDTSA